jgi:hypothetical protein
VLSVSYCSPVTFCAYQTWRRRTPSTGVAPRARIMRIGAANRLAHVAPWRAACSRKRLALKGCTSATLAPAETADANE